MAAGVQVAAEGGEGAWDKVLHTRDLPVGKKRCVRLRSTGRGILLLNIDGELFAMDHACYHHGGPLIPGDIEDMAGHTVLVCPWHRYKIDVRTGECLYVGLDPVALSRGEKKQELRTKGKKQRVHPTKVGKDGYIYVQDSAPADVQAKQVERLQPPTAAAAAAAPSSAPQGFLGSLAAGVAGVFSGGASRSQPAAAPAPAPAAGAGVSFGDAPSRSRHVSRQEQPAGWLPSDDYSHEDFGTGTKGIHSSR